MQWARAGRFFPVWDEASDWDAKGCGCSGDKSKDGFRGGKEMALDNKMFVLRLAKINMKCISAP